jgi:hypothetical protein
MFRLAAAAAGGSRHRGVGTDAAGSSRPCALHPPQRMQSLHLFSRARKSGGPTRHAAGRTCRAARGVTSFHVKSESSSPHPPREQCRPAAGSLSPRFGPHCCRFVLRPYITNNLPPIDDGYTFNSFLPVAPRIQLHPAWVRVACIALGGGPSMRGKDGQTPSTPTRRRVRRTLAHVRTGASELCCSCPAPHAR